MFIILSSLIRIKDTITIIISIYKIVQRCIWRNMENNHTIV